MMIDDETTSNFRDDCEATPAQIFGTTAYPRQHRSEVYKCENKIAASHPF